MVEVLDGVEPLLDRYDSFLVDQFGVLFDGAGLLPEAREAMIAIRQAGKRVVILSNSGRRAAANLGRLSRLGLEPELYTGLVSSGEAAWQGLRDGTDPTFAGLGRRCLFFSRGADRSAVAGLDLEPVADAAAADFVLLAGLDAEDEARAPVARELERALARRLPLLCTNPDVVSLEGERLVEGPGAFAARYAAGGGEVRYVGKPWPAVYRAALRQVDLPPERTCAVGDSLEHDIGGAAPFDIDGALVMSGIHADAFAGADGPEELGRRLESLCADHGGLRPRWLLRAFRSAGGRRTDRPAPRRTDGGAAAATRPPSLAELDRFSAEIGRDPEQVQAAGGNTSVKVGDVLWVKASGLWLADAERRDVFVPVRRGEVLDGIAQGVADPVSGAVVRELNPDGLRPSIETTLHALLPHTVVVHTHSVRTLALAIREDGEALLAERLDGLDWLHVPYRKPGLPLTQAIAERLRERPSIDVIVLGNHGLVVGGEAVEAAASLLAEVERRLDAPPREAPAGDAALLARAAAASGLREVRHLRAHGVATDPLRTERACAGSLYPDHVIFVGPAATLLPADGTVAAAPAASASKLFVVPGAGLLLSPGTTRSADELALCLALVLERVPDGASLRHLTAEDEAELLDWDAEKYRQTLAQTRRG